LQQALQELQIGGTRAAGAPHVFNVSVENSFDFRSDEYAGLFDRSCATAFQHPLWLDRLYSQLAPELGAQPVVITVRRSGSLAMLLPLVRRDYAGMKLVEFADLRVSDYASPVCDAETFAAILADRPACERIRAALKPYDLVRIQKLGDDALALDRLLGPAARTSMEMSAHMAPLFSPYAQWRQDSIDVSYQRELDRKRRKLHRRGELRLECLSDPEKIEAAFACMQSYRQIRFGDDEECDLLQTSAYFQFYLDMAMRGAATGFSRLYTRYMNQQPIAVVWGLAHRGHFLVLLTGFDLTGYKNKSIGSIAFEDIARDCIERGDSMLDFTIGDESYKQLFGARPMGMWMISIAGSRLGSLANFVAGNIPWATRMAKRFAQRAARVS
jgi:CelD/BcsL family acetyltransferase involved in cellulose biosynthesis